MDINEIEAAYQKHYISFEFERLALFEALKEQCPDVKKILYLGSSIHVTPSFVFPQVSYVDFSLVSDEFFQDISAVKAFVEKHKQYDEEVQLDFVNVDYKNPAKPIDDDYDLVISILAPASLTKSLDYLKRGGMLLYKPLPSDNQIRESSSLPKWLGTFEKKQGYVFEAAEGRSITMPDRNTRFMENGKFVELGSYYLFENS